MAKINDEGKFILDWSELKEEFKDYDELIEKNSLDDITKIKHIAGTLKSWDD